MLLVLTGVTAISVALLAYVNELTKGPIAEANAKTLNEALKKVLPEFTNNPVAESDTIFSEKDGKKNVDFIVYPAKNGEELVGTAVEAKSMGFGGELKVLVGFDADGKINYHRDYWDAAEELYMTLPIIGTFMRWIQRRFSTPIRDNP